MANNTQNIQTNHYTKNYQRERAAKDGWQNRLIAAKMMNNANPATMFGYLLSNAFLRRPFQNWLETKVFGNAERKPTDTEVTATYQFTTPEYPKNEGWDGRSWERSSPLDHDYRADLTFGQTPSYPSQNNWNSQVQSALNQNYQFPNPDEEKFNFGW